MEAALKMMSSADLEALASGDISRVSAQGLKVLASGGQNPDFEAGRNQAGGAARGAMSVLQGPTFGFGDEILGAAGAAIDKLKGKPGSFGDLYQQNRDYVRGAQSVEQEAFPIFTAITQGMAAAPLSLIGAPGGAAGLGGMTTQAMKTGGIIGGISGLGNSTASDAAGMGIDALKGSALGAASAGVITPVAAGMGSAGKNMMARLSETSAGAFAREKVAEALARDAKGSTFTSGQSNPAGQVVARINKLGPEAALVDAGGQNTRQLLDTLATLPGRTKNEVENAIRMRQATRADRLIGAAGSQLNPAGGRLMDTVDELVAQRAKAAIPIYDTLYKRGTFIDGELRDIIDAAHQLGAGASARKIATAKQIPYSLAPDTKWSGFRELDYLKQGLDDVIAANTKQDGTLTKVGAAVYGLKRDLVGKLDELSGGLYKSARDAFAGPSALIDAANAGRRALTLDDQMITRELRNLSTSEAEAFRLGAFEAMRAKLGRQAGQTEIMNLWREPAVQEKLKALFGNERAYREFASTVAAERTMRGLEAVGRGSQTAARQAGMGDLDVSALTDAASAITNAKAGNVLGVVGAARNAWGRVATPQNVRDQMGSILLQRGPQAQATVESMPGLLAQINRNNGLLADSYGISGGLIGSQIGPAIPLGLLGR